MKKHLHLVMDSIYTKQFYDYFLEINELNNHHFLLVDLEMGKCETHFVNCRKSIYRFKKNDFKQATIQSEIYTLINSFDNIHIHYLYNFYCDFFIDLPFSFKEKNFFWMVWGADLYNYIAYEKYDGKTIKRFPSAQKQEVYSEEFLRKRKLFIQNLAGICTTSQFDYELVKKNYDSASSRIDIQYNTSQFIEVLKNEELGKPICDDFINVMVGNSGDKTNNHETVFLLMEKFLPGKIKINVPLSYGDKDEISVIKTVGKEILGDYFYPQEEYLDFDSYVNYVNTSACIVMNHYRQQGVGNILIALFLGKALFLSEKSPIYSDLVGKGFVIYKTEILINMSFEDFKTCCDMDYAENIRKVKEYYGEKKVVERFREFYCNL